MFNIWSVQYYVKWAKKKKTNKQGFFKRKAQSFWIFSLKIAKGVEINFKMADNDSSRVLTSSELKAYGEQALANAQVRGRLVFLAQVRLAFSAVIYFHPNYYYYSLSGVLLEII